MDKTYFDLSTRAVAYGVRERTLAPAEIGRARRARYCSRRDRISPWNSILIRSRPGCKIRAGKHSPTYKILLFRRILEVGDANRSSLTAGALAPPASLAILVVFGTLSENGDCADMGFEKG